MRITESQLRRIVKRLISEQASPAVLPKVGDHFECFEWQSTDQARTAPKEKPFYQQMRWNSGDQVEVVFVEPSKEWEFGSAVVGGRPERPFEGSVDSYKIYFRSLTPKDPPKNYVDERFDPLTTVYDLELKRFKRHFKPV